MEISPVISYSVLKENIHAIIVYLSEIGYIVISGPSVVDEHVVPDSAVITKQTQCISSHVRIREEEIGIYLNMCGLLV